MRLSVSFWMFSTNCVSQKTTTKKMNTIMIFCTYVVCYYIFLLFVFFIFLKKTNTCLHGRYRILIMYESKCESCVHIIIFLYEVTHYKLCVIMTKLTIFAYKFVHGCISITILATELDVGAIQCVRRDQNILWTNFKPSEWLQLHNFTFT